MSQVNGNDPSPLYSGGSELAGGSTGSPAPFAAKTRKGKAIGIRTEKALSAPRKRGNLPKRARG